MVPEGGAALVGSRLCSEKYRYWQLASGSRGGTLPVATADTPVEYKQSVAGLGPRHWRQVAGGKSWRLAGCSRGGEAPQRPQAGTEAVARGNKPEGGTRIFGLKIRRACVSQIGGNFQHVFVCISVLFRTRTCVAPMVLSCTLAMIESRRA